MKNVSNENCCLRERKRRFPTTNELGTGGIYYISGLWFYELLLLQPKCRHIEFNINWWKLFTVSKSNHITRAHNADGRDHSGFKNAIKQPLAVKHNTAHDWSRTNEHFRLITHNYFGCWNQIWRFQMCHMIFRWIHYSDHCH